MQQRVSQWRKAFTLIELLIVVAIIAILAAIAVPNFLEAQVRSKISRVKADMRTVATGLEAYTVDHNRPPLGVVEWGAFAKAFSFDAPNSYAALTTPVSYLTSIPLDPFGEVGKIGSQGKSSQNNPYVYNSIPSSQENINIINKNGFPNTSWQIAPRLGYAWFLESWGPSIHQFSNAMGTISALAQQKSGGSKVGWVYPWKELFYDSTNGTVSYGYLVRTNKGIEPAS